MAANKVLQTIKISSFLTLFLAFMAAHSQDLPPKETKLTLFMHDFFGGGSNATVMFVAGLTGKEWGFYKFGTVAVVDELLTQDIQLHSKPIARSHGTYTIASLDGVNAKVQATIVFNNEEYNGSTLELAGLYNQFASVTEVPIVSGTDYFRFARGFVTYETVLYDVSSSYAVMRCNITVQHLNAQRVM